MGFQREQRGGAKGPHSCCPGLPSLPLLPAANFATLNHPAISLALEINDRFWNKWPFPIRFGNFMHKVDIYRRVSNLWKRLKEWFPKFLLQIKAQSHPGDLFSPTQQVLALQGEVGEGKCKVSNPISVRATISIENLQGLAGKLITLLI